MVQLRLYRVWRQIVRDAGASAPKQIQDAVHYLPQVHCGAGLRVWLVGARISHCSSVSWGTMGSFIKFSTSSFANTLLDSSLRSEWQRGVSRHGMGGVLGMIWKEACR